MGCTPWPWAPGDSSSGAGPGVRGAGSLRFDGFDLVRTLPLDGLGFAGALGVLARLGAHLVAVAGSSMISGRWSVALGMAAALTGMLVGGCDQNCQSTCAHIYDDGECGISVSGVPAKQLRDECEIECQNALKEAGEMGSYNPYNHANPADPPELENERQAAEWMNCVWSVECSQLDPSTGICAPI